MVRCAELLAGLLVHCSLFIPDGNKLLLRTWRRHSFIHSFSAVLGTGLRAHCQEHPLVLVTSCYLGGWKHHSTPLPKSYKLPGYGVIKADIMERDKKPTTFSQKSCFLSLLLKLKSELWLLVQTFEVQWKLQKSYFRTNLFSDPRSVSHLLADNRH